MAFKSLDKYVEDKNKDFFLLPNNKDFADVIFLYRGRQDVLVADTHYIKSPDYSGYVHCCGKNCPACEKGIRVQSKLFIPLFNYKTGKIEFWDRSTYFERQLENDVLSKYPNPSEWVFRITRDGKPNDQNTRYTIVAQGKNSKYPYEKILADHNITLPDGYESACSDRSADELKSLLNATTATPTSEYSYVPTPRASANDYQPASTSIPEPVTVPVPEYNTEYAGPDAAVPGMPPVIDEGVPFVESSPATTDQSDDLGDVNF